MINLIIFDWKRTLYDPDEKTLINGAIELLEFLKDKNIPMILVGKGGEDMDQEVERLGVSGYFRQVIFAEGEKDPSVFTPYISKDNSKRCVFIGDRVRSELEIGNRLGATTIWVKQGKFKDEKPVNKNQEPQFVVTNLKDCLVLIKKFI